MTKSSKAPAPQSPVRPLGETKLVISPQELRQPEPNVIDQRQQQIDPAGKHRIDPDARPDGNTKQPGNLGTASKPPASSGE